MVRSGAPAAAPRQRAAPFAGPAHSRLRPRRRRAPPPPRGADSTAWPSTCYGHTTAGRPPRAGARRRGGAAGLLAAAAQALYLARAGGGGARWADVGALPLVAVVGIVDDDCGAAERRQLARPLRRSAARGGARAEYGEGEGKGGEGEGDEGPQKSSFDAATDALDEMVGDGGMYPSITMVAAAGDVQSFSFNDRTAACAPHTEGYAKASPLRRGRAGRRQSPVRR